jgi:hypothetical protein
MKTNFVGKFLIRVLFFNIIIFFQPGLLFGQEIPEGTRFELDSVRISKIIVGSDDSNIIEYEKVESIITGVIDKIELSADNNCIIEVKEKEIPTIYEISGNTISISYNNKKNVYIYDYDGSILSLKYDNIFEKPLNGIELGYYINMEYKIVNRQ